MENQLIKTEIKKKYDINFKIISENNTITKSVEVLLNNLYILKFTDNQIKANVEFLESTKSTLSLHNLDEDAHPNIVEFINREIADLNNQTSKKVEKEDGKGLSTNDLTNILKANYDTSYTNTHTHNNKALLDALITSGNGNYYLTNDGTYKSVSVGMIINSLGSTSSNKTLVANQVTTASFNGTPAITLPTVSDNTKETKAILDFTTTNASYPTINTTGITLKKKDGKAMTYSTVSGVRNRLIFTTIDGGSNWEVELQLYGGVETTFIQPTLADNGTLGGSSFAVYASNPVTGYEAYKAFDNTPATYADAYFPSAYLTIYNPLPLKLSQLDIINSSQANAIQNYTLCGSNDNSIFTTLISGTNTTNGSYAAWGIAVPSNVRDFYKYYKLLITSGFNASVWTASQINMQATYIATS